MFAIKTPKRRTATALGVLRDEGRLLERFAAVDGLVPLHDVIDDRLGAGLVLGLAERGSLDRTLIDHGARSVDETIEVLDVLAGTLDALHRTGIVHADVKPSNVLVRGDNSVWLSDVGSAIDRRGPARPRRALHAV